MARLSFISVIIQCQNSNAPLTKHQKSIDAKLMKWYCNTKHLTLMAKLAELKHDLKGISEFFRNEKLLAQQNSINKKFQLNKKTVFRERRNRKTDIKVTPSKVDIERFWSSISARSSIQNENAKWLKTLENNYCKNVTPKVIKLRYKHSKKH